MLRYGPSAQVELVHLETAELLKALTGRCSHLLWFCSTSEFTSQGCMKASSFVLGALSQNREMFLLQGSAVMTLVAALAVISPAGGTGA